ncbi:hypothetical protein FRC07_010883, partial [Ceratobasidium sp. 392]
MNKRYDVNLPFQRRHVKCVNGLITTHRSLVFSDAKAAVDRVFDFTIEESQHNKDLYKALLPLNFQFKDVNAKMGPLSHCESGHEVFMSMFMSMFMSVLMSILVSVL